jgi:hypothetical protein
MVPTREQREIGNVVQSIYNFQSLHYPPNLLFIGIICFIVCLKGRGKQCEKEDREREIHNLQALCPLRLSKHFFQRNESLINVMSLRLGDAYTHMPESNISRRNRLMQAAGEDHTALQ